MERLRRRQYVLYQPKAGVYNAHKIPGIKQCFQRTSSTEVSTHRPYLCDWTTAQGEGTYSAVCNGQHYWVRFFLMNRNIFSLKRITDSSSYRCRRWDHFCAQSVSVLFLLVKQQLISLLSLYMYAPLFLMRGTILKRSQDERTRAPCWRNLGILPKYSHLQ